MKIKKAVIPAAGLGTRFLPATKALPKEMLPIVDRPTIQYIVEEAVRSGIESILIITGPGKYPIENHFDVSFELEMRLKASGEEARCQMIRDVADLADITYIRQKEPKGLGHAILRAKAFVGNEPFAVLLGDDIVDPGQGPDALRQLIDVYEEVGHSILGVQRVPREDVYKYGIIAPSDNGQLSRMIGMVEKPPCYEAPSDLAVLGRYILSPAIFPLLETQTPGKNNEIQLTDAIKRLIDIEDVYCYQFSGTRYDVGDKFGFLKATIDFALARPDLREELRRYIKELAKKED